MQNRNVEKVLVLVLKLFPPFNEKLSTFVFVVLAAIYCGT